VRVKASQVSQHHKTGIRFDQELLSLKNVSIDERHLALGRAVEEYASSKRELSLLANSARDIVAKISHIAEYLKKFADDRELPRLPPPAALPDADDVQALIDAITKAIENRNRLCGILRDAGAEPKD
jgi:hypothetical protein